VTFSCDSVLEADEGGAADSVGSICRAVVDRERVGAEEYIHSLTVVALKHDRSLWLRLRHALGDTTAPFGRGSIKRVRLGQGGGGEAFALELAEQLGGLVDGAAEAVDEHFKALDGRRGSGLEAVREALLEGEGGAGGGVSDLGMDCVVKAADEFAEVGGFGGFEAAGLDQIADDAMDEFGFGGADGAVVGEEVVEERLVGGGVLGEVGFQAGIEAVLEGVGADGGAAARGDGAGGELRVGAVGFALTGGRHENSFGCGPGGSRIGGSAAGARRGSVARGGGGQECWGSKRLKRGGL